MRVAFVVAFTAFVPTLGCSDSRADRALGGGASSFGTGGMAGGGVAGAMGGGSGGAGTAGLTGGAGSSASGDGGSGSPLGGAGGSAGGADVGGGGSGAQAGAGAAGDAGAAGAGGSGPNAELAPSGLMVELLTHPEETEITDTTPDFGWIVPLSGVNERQTAFRILVASRETFDEGTADLWDSGKTPSSASVNVPYAGKALAASTTYWWKVQTWDSRDRPSLWSAAQRFVMAARVGTYSTPKRPVALERLAPTVVTMTSSGHYFVDFGRAAFGWLEVALNAPSAGTVSVTLGEKALGQTVDKAPGATVRAATASVTLQQGQRTYRVTTPADTRNTTGDAIALPSSLGVVLPFRYVELSNVPVALTADMLRQVAVHYPADGAASSFKSSNPTLDQVMGISRYSIIATTFAGVYVDGDRERIPYEGDAYIQQLGHYAVDREFALARYSHEYLLSHATWPTEWKQHSVSMAWNDWMYTGNIDSLSQAWDVLVRDKTLEAHVDADGLLDSGSLMDLVDWPETERDGFVMTARNAVVNAFFCLNLQQMAEMAAALGKTSDATRYRDMATRARASFNTRFFDTNTGRYLDSVGGTHSSLHANLFPLAFGLVPEERKATVVAFVKSKGMACSVYAAQYLLEALYRAGEADAALALMTATSDRSWMNMIRVGSTITMEAWDVKYKSNLDWNHAWGAAPANVVPRYLIGVQPLEPGFAKAAIQPRMGSLTHAEAVVPTIRGPIGVSIDRTNSTFSMTFTLPANMTANVALPASCTPALDGATPTVVSRDGVRWIDAVGSGSHELRCP
jgi:hypothetical protein